MSRRLGALGRWVKLMSHGVNPVTKDGTGVARPGSDEKSLTK